MYAEIWLDRLNRIGHLNDESSEVSHSGYRRPDQKAVYDLLAEAYNSTGEPDSRTGFQSLLPSDPGRDIRHYEQENQWFQSLEIRDALASYVDSPDAQQTPGIL